MAIRADHGETSAEGKPPRWWRRHLVGLVAAAGFVILASWGVGYWLSQPHPPSYAGQTRTVDLQFRCLNGIFWDDPDTDYQWWAGGSPVLPSNLDTSPPTPGSPPIRHVTGNLHFDSDGTATLTSDAGGILILTRQPRYKFYEASCSLQ